jgi:hypothetical protein
VSQPLPTWQEALTLVRPPQAHLVAAGVYTVDGDINDTDLLVKLFGICKFTHVLHLAAQVDCSALTTHRESSQQPSFCSLIRRAEIVAQCALSVCRA